MSIEYDLFANPPRPGETKPTLHARAINIQTVDTNELARMIEGMSTFTSADIKGAIKAISERLFYCLSNSQSVHLDGIGTFSVTLKCRPVENKKDIRAASIAFKNVEFRADPELKKRFRGARIERREGTTERKAYNEDIRQKRILWYIKNYGTINQTVAADLNQCTRQKAKKDLEQLIEDNQIQKNWCGRRAFYIRRSNDQKPPEAPSNEAIE
ncbi:MULTISPECIES: HU family DNA-binding protein [Parabacteroides]|uniref:HU family DNA-binding protein n=1 Tax=Parabacteroides leei TaxID=2939491 RepID=UPI001898C925|nr:MULTISPECIES: HU family DNA-binding protein [Parabacteroides]MCL3853584.1 HU family DNA-binding protein [Parabacteroides leei]